MAANSNELGGEELQATPKAVEEEPHPELKALIQKLEENKEKIELDQFFDRYIKWSEKYPLAWKRLCEALSKSKHVASITFGQHSFSAFFPLNGWMELCNAIRENKSIQALHFHHGLAVKKEYIELFFKALDENSTTTITSLNVSNCRMGENACLMKELANYLRKTKKLRRLGLKWEPGELDPSDIRPLCDALSSNKSLTHLQLELNSIDDHPEARRALFTALGNNTSLTTVDLSHNRLGKLDDSSFRVFCNDFLNKTKTVTTLSLAYNGLDGSSLDVPASGEHIHLLWNALAVNQTIQFLDISHNFSQVSSSRPSRPEYFRTLCEAIAKNKTLKGLNLSGNNLGEYDDSNAGKKNERWHWLCDALTENKSINELNLACNDLGALSPNAAIGKEEWQQFRSMLTKKPLTSLDLCYNGLEDIPNEFLNLLHEGLDKCSTLTSLDLDRRSRRTVRVEDQDLRAMMLYKTYTSPQFTELYLPSCSNRRVFENKEREADFLRELAQNTRLTVLHIPERISPAMVPQYRAIPILNITLQHFESARGMMNRGIMNQGRERAALSGPLCTKILSFLYVSIGTEKNHQTLRELVVQRVSNHIAARAAEKERHNERDNARENAKDNAAPPPP